VATLLTFLQGQSLPTDQLNQLNKGIWQRSEPSYAAPFKLETEDKSLEARLKEISTLKGLHAGVFVIDPTSGLYASLDGKSAFSAASMIKFPILVSYLAALDTGELKQDQKVTIRQDLITGGSGYLQWRPVGSKVTLSEVAELMMVVSDNTATNIIIDALGGKARLNREFSNWGLKQTKINNWLGDFEGTNMTSPYDLVYLMGLVDNHEILSKSSRDLMFQIMRRTRIRTLLPPGLPPGSVIAHKTGDIGSMVGDAGLVTTPGGAKYIVSVQVSRPHNDRRANLLVRNISKEISQDFGTVKLKPAPMPVEPSLEKDASPEHDKPSLEEHDFLKESPAPAVSAPPPSAPKVGVEPTPAKATPPVHHKSRHHHSHRQHHRR
jgi:beta-lactamase class A